MLYEILSIIVIVIVIAMFVYRYFSKVTPIAPQNIIQQQVFLVKVHDNNKLGEGHLTGQFKYATNDMINTAIKSGLRASVSVGDIILYVDPDSAYNNQIPNAYIATGVEFSSSDNINLSNNATSKDTINKINWACVYGYKPVQTYRKESWMIFVQPINSTDYYGIQAFSPSSWNSPQTDSARDSVGAEVIWVSLNNGNWNIPASASQINNLLLDQNFKLATVEQYLWTYSNGIGAGWNQTVYCATANDPTDDSLTYFGSIWGCTTNCSSCLNIPLTNGLSTCTGSQNACVCMTNKKYNGNVIALWGIRQNLKTPIITGIPAVIIPFNSTKNSQYN